MRKPLGAWKALALLATPLAASAAPLAIAAPDAGSMNVRWNAGAPDCRPGAEPAIQVHAYNPATFVLRESLCLSSEGPFAYLLIGADRALLIDTGAVADAARAPLARTVLSLLPMTASGRLPLLVVHTHRHRPAGDAQFAHVAGVQVAGYDLASVRRFFGFAAWPESQAQIDLGGRVVDVLPAPGRQAADLVFYDRRTALLFTGEFLQPGPLVVEDAAADAASARRIAAFAADKPIAAVLGGHVDMNLDGKLYQWGARYHPDERPLQLSKTELMALPGIVDGFRGVYARRGGFTLINQAYLIDLAEAAGAIALVVLMAGLAAMILKTRRWLAVLKRRTASRARAPKQSNTSGLTASPS